MAIEAHVEVAEGNPSGQQRYQWRHKLAALLLIVMCFEIGVFLLVFPWLRSWDLNGIASLRPWLRVLWANAFFRGALSGLGVVNIGISLHELFRLRRFSAY